MTLRPISKKRAKARNAKSLGTKLANRFAKDTDFEKAGDKGRQNQQWQAKARRLARISLYIKQKGDSDDD